LGWVELAFIHCASC